MIIMREDILEKVIKVHEGSAGWGDGGWIKLDN